MSPVADTTSAVTGGDDMFAGIPADAFEGAENITEPTEDAGEITEEVAEEAEEPVAEVEEPVQEEEAQPEAEAQQEEQQQDELPEGVRAGKDRKGKDAMFVTPERWKTIYDNGYKTLQQMQEIAGQSLTPDDFRVRNDAYDAQELLFSHLTSGDTQLQGNLVNYFLDQISEARQSGEVGGNPAIPLAQSFVQAIQQREPEAYSAIRDIAAKEMVESLYRAAAEKGDKNLFLSLGHVADNLGLPYKTEADMQAFFQSRGQQDPVSALKAENAKLQEQLTGRHANSAAAQLQQWHQQTGQTVRQGILEDAIKPTVNHLQSEGYWKTHPEAFQHHVIDRLNSAVQDVLKKDTAFGKRIDTMTANASRATSAQKRAEIAEAIKSAYVSRAQLATDALKKQVLKDATDWAITQSNSRHARHEAGQQQRGPRGTGSNVPKSLIPARPASSSRFFDAAEEARIAASLMS